MYETINKEIGVLSYSFSGGNTKRFFPRKIEVEGRELDLLETGIRMLVKKGQNFIQIFMMSDGNNQYRLSFEPENRLWTMLGRKAQA